MRRPAPSPPADVVDLDYGSAEVTIDNVQLQDKVSIPSANEVAAVTASAVTPVPAKPLNRRRELLAYDTDDFDTTGTPPLSSPAHLTATDGAQDLDDVGLYGENAVAGPSSENCPLPESAKPVQYESQLNAAAPSFDPYKPATMDVSADVQQDWQSGSLQYPPPHPPHPPPSLPYDDEPYNPAQYGYDPTAPEFHPGTFPPAPPGVFPDPEQYHAAHAPQTLYASGGYAHAPENSWDPPYDPHAPYDQHAYGAAPPQHAHTYQPYPPPAPYPIGYAGQMDRFQQKRLLKQQKKKEKRLKKRELKQAAAAAAALHSGTGPANHFEADHATNVEWTEDGKAQAKGMISELHARGVPAERLLEKGLPRALVEGCCAELGISMSGEARKEPQAPAPAATEDDSNKMNNAGLTTPAEDELLSKKKCGIVLTPLEELRQKALASKLVKAAAAATAAKQAAASSLEQGPGQPAARPTTTVFDRSATSGEADALLSQVAETIRSLLRPVQNDSTAATHAAIGDQPSEDSTQASRKRTYRDVDAVDNEDVGAVADLAYGEINPTEVPTRRQRISYADTFSRRPAAPAGEVDLNAPLLDLPDLSEAATRLPQMSQSPARRRRPVAADFDTAEYRPPNFHRDRFLDVPSGLNTVIDLSDDEVEAQDLENFEVARGWMEAELDVDRGEILLLRQKTASEHYDNFCSLNGLQPVRTALAPQGSEANENVVMVNGRGAAIEGVVAQMSAATVSSSEPGTPSRDELQRKELEIKQLMRKIQMMEERKSKQASATPSASPLPSPMPGHISQPFESSLSPAPSAQETPNVDTESPSSPSPISKNGGGSVKLDPALQQQREKLLALLASKRKAVTPKTKGYAKDEVANAADSNSESAAQQDQAVEQQAKETSLQPSVVSRYKPLVPSLLQSVATRVRSYLPPALGFGISRADEKDAERTSVKWCTREADGGQCTDSACSQRHVAEFKNEEHSSES